MDSFGTWVETLEPTCITNFYSGNYYTGSSLRLSSLLVRFSKTSSAISELGIKGHWVNVLKW